MRIVTEDLAEKIPVSRACDALDYPRSSLYRQRRLPVKKESCWRPTPPRALSSEEKTEVLAVLNSERFQDQAPHQVYGTLLDEGVYYCSVSTMYRILRANNQVHERRDQRQHPEYVRPELLTSEPNQLWSWDITKLRGPVVWTYYYLYVLLDVFSRFVVGWLLAEVESAELAEALIATTCQREGIQPEQLGLHSDRGPAMQSKTIAQLLIDLEVARPLPGLTRPMTTPIPRPSSKRSSTDRGSRSALPRWLRRGSGCKPLCGGTIISTTIPPLTC